MATFLAVLCSHPSKFKVILNTFMYLTTNKNETLPQISDIFDRLKYTFFNIFNATKYI